MKKKIKKSMSILCLTFFSILFFLGCSKEQPQAASVAIKQPEQPQETGPKEADIVIAHFNDFHAAFRSFGKTDEENLPQWSGAAVMGGYINKLRRDNTNSLVVFAGDMFQKSPLDKLSKGEKIIDIFNLFKLDVATLGNHEFDFGRERFDELKSKIKHPLVSANLFDRDGGKPYVEQSKIIKTKNDVKVLFIGLFPVSGKKYMEKDHNLKIENPQKIVKDIAAKFEKDVDLTVVLSHLGYEDDIELSKKLSGAEVDLIIGGHSHTYIDKIDKELPIPVVQANFNGTYLGEIDLTVDRYKNEIKKIDYKLQPTMADGIDKDSEIDEIVKGELNKIADDLKPIAKLEKPLGQESRTEETALGDFSVDALVDIFKADLAFTSSKSIRNSISGPDVCVNDIYEAFPFDDNKIFETYVTGENIIKMLEYYMNKRKDRFVYIPYTLSYTYSKSDDDKIEISDIKFKNKELKKNKKYRVILDERTVEEFEKFYNAENSKEIGDSFAGEYIKYLKKIKKYNPKPSGRVKNAA